MCSDCRAAKPQQFAILDHAQAGHAWPAAAIAQLRIVFRQHSRSQTFSAAPASDHRGTGIPRQGGQPAAMVKMRFCTQNIFDVFGVKAQFADIVQYRRRRLRQRAVDQYQARACVDQRDAQPTKADEITVPE